MATSQHIGHSSASSTSKQSNNGNQHRRASRAVATKTSRKTQIVSIDQAVDSTAISFATSANIPFVGSGMIEVAITLSPKTQRAFRVDETLTLPVTLVEDGFNWKVGDTAIVDASIKPRVGDTVVLAGPHSLLIGYVCLDDKDAMVFCAGLRKPIRFVLNEEPVVSEYTFLGTAVELRRKYPN